MANFTHSLECSRDLVVSSDQDHFCHLAIAPHPTPAFLWGKPPIPTPVVLVGCPLGWHVTQNGQCLADIWHGVHGEPGAVFPSAWKPVWGMKLDKIHAESWRERALATRLKSRDAAMPNVLTSVLKSVFCYQCLDLTKQVGPVCLTSKYILGL